VDKPTILASAFARIRVAPLPDSGWRLARIGAVLTDIRRANSLGAVLILAFAPLAVLAAAEPAPVTVDLAKTRAPISKYVYGQFIEHLGRCIQGGMWAEMLEDRKFFYPVDGEMPAWALQVGKKVSWEGDGYPWEALVRSPWMIVGDKRAVVMSTARPFTGAHTPVVTASAAGNGIVQERLGLVEGRRYVARVVLSGDAAAAPVQVSLVWGSGSSDRQVATVASLRADYEPTTLTFVAGASTDNGRLSIVSHGSGSFVIGAVSLMPEDNVHGWRADTLARLRELDAPVYRWPGGNFVSGYDWKDGIGDRDRRPPRKNPAWKGVESNDVGIDEFLALTHELGTEPYIAVNTGLGAVEAAAEEVEYVNGAATTKWGAKRAANGHPEPYAVKWWGIGNEMYGEWQLGHMPLADYVAKHRRVVDAMRAVDRSIEPVAVGAVGEWSQEMLKSAAGHMTLLSEHTYWQEKPDVPAHVAQAVEAIRKIADAHRAYRRTLPSLRGKDVRLALDEWNYWYGPFEYGELGTRYFLQDGLGAAAALHEMVRNSDLFFMANYAQTVNVIGAIKATATAAEMEPTGLVLALYRKHLGVTPVAIAGVPAPLDAVAALSADRRALTIAVVNPTDEARALPLSIASGTLSGSGRRWVLTGKDRRAHNRPGAPRGVDVREEPLSGGLDRLEVGPLSVTLVSLDLR
jgi:alpha-N-arabinofuranosidase